MFSTPILFLVFNRPEETRKVFNVIRELAPTKLYIAADGPRVDRAGEEELCRQVQQIVRQIDWECEVKELFRQENLGCRNAVSTAINWFFSDVERGIILEDDCLPDLSFFPYCEKLLEKYKDDEKIISIGGTNLGYNFINGSSYSFSRFMNMWGWATWRRSAELVDYEMERWQRLPLKQLFLHRKLQSSIVTVDYNWIKYWKNYFDLTASGQIDTWDYQWIFAQLYYNKLSVFPAQNLIKNIGFSATATHTFHLEHPVKDIPLGSLTQPLVLLETKCIDIEYEENFIKKIWFNYRKDTLYRILRSDLLNSPWVLKLIGVLKKRLL